MRIKIFFPIIDFRSFINKDTYKINSPTWPYPTPNAEFIRNFGQVKSRIDWDQERLLYFCDAKNSIKFRNFSQLTKILNEYRFKKCYTLKSVYVNNEIESIFEVCFNFIPKDKIISSISRKLLFLLLKEILNLTVKFTSLSEKENKNEFKLKDLGRTLSKFYLHSTTQTKKIESTENWWVLAGHPLIIVENNYNEMQFHGQESKVLEFPAYNILASHILFKDKEYISNLWRICKKEKNEDYDKNILMKLVQSIVNIHSEYEGIKQVLKLIIKKDLVIQIGNKASDDFQNYLNRTITKLTKKERNTLPQENIFNIVSLNHEDIISKTDYNVLLNQLSKIRRNVLRKVMNFTVNKEGDSPLIDSLNLGANETEIFKDITMEELRTKIFISYSHKDKEWLKRLIVHFKPIARSGLIDLWSDEKIQIGQIWRDEIDKALKQTKVAILLVSADFLDSDFIYNNELPVLLNVVQRKGAIIIPVIIKPSFFANMPELSKFKAFNDPKRPLLSMNEYEQEELLANLASTVFEFLNLNFTNFPESDQTKHSTNNQATSKDIKSSILFFIKNNKIESALNLLFEYFGDTDQNKQKDIVILTQRWKENSRRRDLNLTSNEDYNLYESNVVDAILRFL